MRLVLILLCLFATSVAADDADEPVVMTPAQHLFLVHRLMEMQQTIDEQAKQLQDLKESLGCA